MTSNEKAFAKMIAKFMKEQDKKASYRAKQLKAEKHNKLVAKRKLERKHKVFGRKHN